MTQQIESIARQYLNFENLETRSIDSLDFREVSAWGVKAALQAAFEAGQKAAEASRGGALKKI